MNTYFVKAVLEWNEINESQLQAEKNRRIQPPIPWPAQPIDFSKTTESENDADQSFTSGMDAHTGNIACTSEVRVASRPST